MKKTSKFPIGSGFTYPEPVQENMHRISKIATVIMAKDGEKFVCDIASEVASWFED